MLGHPALKQPQFNWEAVDKYTEWKVFILKVRNMLSTYNAQEQDKIAIAKNCLGRKWLHCIESLTEGEKQACNTLQGLLDTLATKFRPQFNQRIKSLQFRSCVDLRVNVQKNGWGDYMWQQQNVVIERSTKLCWMK